MIYNEVYSKLCGFWYLEMLGMFVDDVWYEVGKMFKDMMWSFSFK